MNFEYFNEEKKERGFSPEIKIGNCEDIYSTIIFYATAKKIEEMWGGEQCEEIAETFRDNGEISQDLVNMYKNVRQLVNGNEEVLRWLAFVVDKEEDMRKKIISRIIKHKGLAMEETRIAMNKFQEMYDIMKEDIDIGEINEFLEKDIDSRKEGLVSLKEDIFQAIDFFQPKNLEIKEVIFLPTNPLEEKQSGNGINLEDIYYINSDKGNRLNEIHEFLHSIINPITERVKLSSEDEDKIIGLSPKRLRDDYESGESILTEEIIRTYGTGLNQSNVPNLVTFRESLLLANKGKIEEFINKEKSQGISLAESAEELLDDEDLMKKYYERYSQDLLAERIWKFFEDYQHSEGCFEDYFITNYKDILN